MPANVESLFFVLPADALLNQIQSLEIGVWQQSQKVQTDYQIADFAQQQISMLMQLYRKNGVYSICSESGFIITIPIINKSLIAYKSLNNLVNFSYFVYVAADIPTAPQSPLVFLYWLSCHIFWVNGLADERF